MDLGGGLAELRDVAQAAVQRGPGVGVARREVGDHEQLGGADHAGQERAFRVPDGARHTLGTKS